MTKVATSVRLTKRVVDSVDPSRGRHCLWDAELKGFGLQVEPTKTMTYIVRYRPKGLGRSGPRRFFKLGRHGDLTPEQARAQAKIILGRVANGEDPAADLKAARKAGARVQRMTFSQLSALFLNEHAGVMSKAATASLYEILLRKHILPILGDCVAEELTRSEIAALHLAMRSNQITANRVVSLISTVYSFAARRSLVPESFNPARGVEKYREEGRERYLTSEELKRLGAALVEAETMGVPWVIDMQNPKAKHTPTQHKGQREITDPYAVAAIRLLLFTGARLREILHLRWEHVDLERGLLFLPASKTGKKTIVLNAAAFDILTALKNVATASRDAPKGVVIQGAIADQPRADLKRPWAAIRRHADLEGVRLHDLRHTFASIGAGASLGLPIVGRLLGHSQPQTTARYAHLDADPLRRAANVIGDHLSMAMKPQG